MLAKTCLKLGLMKFQESLEQLVNNKVFVQYYHF